VTSLLLGVTLTYDSRTSKAGDGTPGERWKYRRVDTDRSRLFIVFDAGVETKQHDVVRVTAL